MAGWVITGTGTEVGKTWVACALIRGWIRAGHRVRVHKVVLTGVALDHGPTLLASDPGQLLQAADQEVTPAAVRAACPFWFRDPLSPDQAAEREGRSLHLAEVLTSLRSTLDEPGLHVLEGAGGVMSPLGVDATQLELFRRLGLPVVLVAGQYLGSLSHTLTALEVLGLLARGVVVNQGPAPATGDRAAHLRSLARFTRLPVVFCDPGQRLLDPNFLASA